MEQAFKIDKNIPLPNGNLHKGSLESQYPVNSMEVGDSFFVPGSKIKPSTVQVAISRLNQRRNIAGTFKVKFITENSVAGARVWRIA